MSQRTPIVHADGDGVRAAADLVARDGVIIYPTETVYGLGCDPRSHRAVQRVRALKGRDADKPMLALTHRWDAVVDWFEIIPSPLRTLMGLEMPPPVTLVFQASRAAPPALVSGLGTIAVRRTMDPTAGALAEAVGGAVLSTSANAAGEPPPTRLKDVAPELVAAVDLAMDAGRPLAGVPSTVVGTRGEELVVYREGAVDRLILEQLARIQA